MKSQTTVLQVGGLNWATSAAVVGRTGPVALRATA